MNSGDRIGAGDGDVEEDASSGDFEQEDEDGSGSASDGDDADDSEEMAGEKTKMSLLDENGEEDDYDGNFEEVIVREPTILLSCLGIGFSNVNRKVT